MIFLTVFALSRTHLGEKAALWHAMNLVKINNLTFEPRLLQHCPACLKEHAHSPGELTGDPCFLQFFLTPLLCRLLQLDSSMTNLNAEWRVL